MNTICGRNQTFVGNKFGSGENPPRHYLSGKMGPVIERDCDLLFILHGHVLKQHTVAASQNRNGLFSSHEDWGAGSTLRVVHITESLGMAGHLI